MFKYHCLNPIAKVGTSRLGCNYAETAEVSEADAILVRSAGMHEMAFSPNLKAIARAGAGVNNIPLADCAKQGIVVFNTPGANANGVKELVIAGMLLAARDIAGGIQWVNGYDEEGDIAKVTEKKKKAFAGTEIQGKRLGVIGLGAIGLLVANAALGLGMEVVGYDPYVTVGSAWKLSPAVEQVKTVEEIYQTCDYISIHVPALPDTIGFICKDAIALMKDTVTILNFSRDSLVNSADMIEALNAGKVKNYVVDFPTADFVGVKGAILIPHLGASTEESEDNCAKMAASEIKDFLENGNILHSVNYPDCDLGPKGAGARVTVLHQNCPDVLGKLTTLLADKGANVTGTINKSRGEYGYTILDLSDAAPADLEEQLGEVEGVIRVRVIS